MVLITSSTDNITLKIDPAVVLATRKYVDDKALELKVYVDDLMAKHLAAPDPHSQYAQKDSPTLTGIPRYRRQRRVTALNRLRTRNLWHRLLRQWWILRLQHWIR